MNPIEKLELEATGNVVPKGDVNEAIKMLVNTYGAYEVVEAFNNAVIELSSENPDNNKLDYTRSADGHIYNPSVLPIVKFIEEYGIYNFFEVVKEVIPTVRAKHFSYRLVLKKAINYISKMLRGILDNRTYVETISKEGYNFSVNIPITIAKSNKTEDTAPKDTLEMISNSVTSKLASVSKVFGGKNEEK